MRQVALLWLVLLFGSLQAAEWQGRVCDENGQPILYATVCLQSNPLVGTATNKDGFFTLTPDTTDPAPVLLISCIGYEKQTLVPTTDTMLITLREQPIALEQTVVQTKRPRLSKRKLLARILHDTYLKMEQDLPQQPIRYHVVSDVRMDAQSAPWGMEEMLADVTELPSTDITKDDSVQFVGTYCRRYCDPDVRRKLDTMYTHEKDAKRRRMAQALDSGSLAHRALWKMRLRKAHFLDTSDELRRWRLSTENDSVAVLTYTRKHNMFGIVRATITENHLIDSYDFTLRGYTMDMQVKLFLPFSIRLKGAELDWLNLLNMGNKTIERFRLKRGNLHVRVSVLYAFREGVLVPVEKNLQASGVLEDRKHNQLPCALRATQQVTSVQTEGVEAVRNYRKNRLVPRILVPIY